jgi:hypothetical protein
MTLDAKRLGFAGGIMWGAALCLLTAFAIPTGYASEFLELVATVYPGYSISITGIFLGLVYGFLDGFIGLWVLAWLYNRLACSTKPAICDTPG